jgi:hypothetical protein
LLLDARPRHGVAPTSLYYVVGKKAAGTVNHKNKGAMLEGMTPFVHADLS